jgi:hypothetical protein
MDAASPAAGDGEKAPRNDLSDIFDLDRTQLISRMTANFESCMRDIQTAQDDLKELVASCKEAQLSPLEIGAMKRIASLRMKDQAGAAREKLEALSRVGKAVGLDLFDWADAK